MNAKNVAVLLVVVCAVLVGGLVYQHIQARDRQEADGRTILSLSNSWTTTIQQLDETKQVNVNLNKTLDETRTESAKTLASASNLLSQTRAELAKTTSDLTQKESDLKTALDTNARQETRINELTTQNAALDRQTGDLKTAIDSLELAIVDTKKKLENAEGDKVVLQSELKRLLAEKAELERQFNDLTALRFQLAKLKEELSNARRLDWIRRGLYGDVKGGQKLMQLSRTSGEPVAPAPSTNYDLNVEVRSDGTLKVIPPADKAQPAPTGP